MKDVYQKFFLQYCKFMSKDLIAYFNEEVGRDAKVIEFFRKIFFIIHNKDLPNDTKYKSLNSLEKLVDEYLAHGSDKDIYSAMSDSLKCNKGHSQPIHYLSSIEHSIDGFYEASKYYIEKQENADKPLKQSLIEFNNALSHLSAGYCASETSWEKNIKKAGTHFHRATLDYYKTIILNKHNLTTLQKEKIVEIRKYEIHSVGVDINNKDKKSIISMYKEFANSL